MSTEDIDKIVRNAIHLQHSISKQINTMSSNNLELSEIIEDIPSAINSLTSDTCNKIIEQHNVQLQNNLTKSLEQINEQINQLRYSSKVIYYKPFIMHTVFFLLMTVIMFCFLNICLKDIKEQRALNEQEIAFINQTKKQAVFSTCDKNNYPCVKFIPNRYYGKNGDYALLNISK